MIRRMSGQLVGHTKQAVVVAAEAVHHQDGAGLRGDPDGFVDPVRDRVPSISSETPGCGLRVRR